MILCNAYLEKNVNEVNPCKLSIHNFKLNLIIGIGGGVLIGMGVCLC